MPKPAFKGTPGPWIEDLYTGCIYDAKGEVLMVGGGGCEEEYRANSHMMAAAFDLYEACKMMNEFWTTPGSDNIGECITAVRAAIEKAEGRTTDAAS